MEEMNLMGEPCIDVLACDMPVSETPLSLPTECSKPECCAGDDIKPCYQDEKHAKFAELAAVLQESVLFSWKLHLKAKKYYVHVILEEYYDEALEIVDGLIEHYQGICNCDIIDDSNNQHDSIKSYDPCCYFKNIKDYLTKFANDSTNFDEKTFEIKSDIDDLLRLVDSTLYKLCNLTESTIKSFDEFVYENL